MGCTESSLSSSTPSGLKLKPTQKSLLEYKIVVLGDSGVGKSSLSLRFCQGKFPQTHEVTIGAAFLQQTVRLAEGSAHKLHIWDSGGQERFRAMAPLYYRDAAGALVVFDASDPRSFESVKFWIEELRAKGPTGCVVYVVANKCDLSSPSAEATAFCASEGLKLLCASALTGEGVASAFEALAEEAVKRKRTASD